MSGFKTGKLFVVTLWTPNIPETLHFYGDILGLEFTPHHEKYPTFTVGDDVHLIIRKETPIPAKDPAVFPVIAFQVDDLDEAIQHLQAHGVELETKVIANFSTRYVMFRDPGGNLLEIAELSIGTH